MRSAEDVRLHVAVLHAYLFAAGYCCKLWAGCQISVGIALANNHLDLGWSLLAGLIRLRR